MPVAGEGYYIHGTRTPYTHTLLGLSCRHGGSSSWWFTAPRYLPVVVKHQLERS
jgi:hypothetical protein